jgi:uncharacterized protein (TIGR00297 family)
MLLALLAAGIVAFLAFLGRLLTGSGAIAATLVGGSAVLAGVPWIALLLFFFVSASLLSRWRAGERERLVRDLVEKADRRDAAQVLANGAVFAVAALSSLGDSSGAWESVAAGAIAAATADTWSTEVGTVVGGTPRFILDGRQVPPGTSGGVTVAGTAAGIVGAILAALMAAALDWEVPILAIAAGGIAGTVVDSLLGALVQERRWCDRCELFTERRTHRCGGRTTRRGGIRGIDNDVVNLVSILAGAGVTWLLA